MDHWSAHANNSTSRTAKKVLRFNSNLACQSPPCLHSKLSIVAHSIFQKNCLTICDQCRFLSSWRRNEERRRLEGFLPSALNDSIWVLAFLFSPISSSQNESPYYGLREVGEESLESSRPIILHIFPIFLMPRRLAARSRDRINL